MKRAEGRGGEGGPSLKLTSASVDSLSGFYCVRLTRTSIVVIFVGIFVHSPTPPLESKVPEGASNGSGMPHFSHGFVIKYFASCRALVLAMVLVQLVSVRGMERRRRGLW